MTHASICLSRSVPSHFHMNFWCSLRFTTYNAPKHVPYMSGNLLHYRRCRVRRVQEFCCCGCCCSGFFNFLVFIKVHNIKHANMCAHFIPTFTISLSCTLSKNLYANWKSLLSGTFSDTFVHLRELSKCHARNWRCSVKYWMMFVIFISRWCLIDFHFLLFITTYLFMSLSRQIINFTHRQVIEYTRCSETISKVYLLCYALIAHFFFLLLWLTFNERSFLSKLKCTKTRIVVTIIKLHAFRFVWEGTFSHPTQKSSQSVSVLSVYLLFPWMNIGVLIFIQAGLSSSWAVLCSYRMRARARCRLHCIRNTRDKNL